MNTKQFPRSFLMLGLKFQVKFQGKCFTGRWMDFPLYGGNYAKRALR